MDFTLTDEQALFRDSVARMIEAGTQTPPVGFSAESYAQAWRDFAELGIAGLCIEESRGGFSGAVEDILLVALEIGRSPTIAPRFETMVLAARLLARTDAPTGAAWRDRLIAGEAQVAVGIAEPNDPTGLSAPTLTATPEGGGYRLDGDKVLVVGGPTAECLIVTAVSPSGELALFAIDPAKTAVERFSYRLADTTPVADISFRSTWVEEGDLLACGERALVALEEARDLGIVAQCAAEVGGMSRSIELTIEHLKTRQQFGRPLADLQVVQHRVADMFIATNNARSSVYAAAAATSETAEVRASAASRCKVAVSGASRTVIGEAVHLHGGIGITAEYLVGHLYRRALVDEQLFGGIDRHVDHLVDRERSGFLAMDGAEKRLGAA